MKSKYDVLELEEYRGEYNPEWFERWLEFNPETKKFDAGEMYGSYMSWKHQNWVGNPNKRAHSCDFNAFLVMCINNKVEGVNRVTETVCLYEKVRFYEIFK